MVAELQCVNINVGCCKDEHFCPQVSITPTSTYQPTICAPDGTLVLWLSGSGTSDGDGDRNGRIRIAPLPARVPPSPSCSLLQLPHCLGYLCHGNCARLPAHTHSASPLLLLPARWLSSSCREPPPPLPSLPHWYKMLVREDGFLLKSNKTSFLTVLGSWDSSHIRQLRLELEIRHLDT